jgi:hypothetical protein
MQVHRTTDSESLSLPTLPTTRAQHGEDRNNKIYYRNPKKPQNLENALYHVLPTPTVGHVRNHDEPVEDYLQRRQDFVDGKTKGMPEASLGVAVRMEILNDDVVSDSDQKGL